MGDNRRRMAINNSLYRNLNYDAGKDLEPVSYIASITNVLIVPADLATEDALGDLIAAAKAAPGN